MEISAKARALRVLGDIKKRGYRDIDGKPVNIVEWRAALRVARAERAVEIRHENTKEAERVANLCSETKARNKNRRLEEESL